MKTAIRGCSTTNAQSNAGSRGRSGRPGSRPIWIAARKSSRGDDEVEQRLDDEARGERRIGRALDAVPGDVELDHVSGAGRHDRVHADAGHVGAERAPVADLRLRVGGLEDVLPRAGAHEQADHLERDRQEQCAPCHGRERLEEGLGGIEKRANIVHALTIAPPLAVGELRAAERRVEQEHGQCERPAHRQTEEPDGPREGPRTRRPGLEATRTNGTATAQTPADAPASNGPRHSSCPQGARSA